MITGIVAAISFLSIVGVLAGRLLAAPATMDLALLALSAGTLAGLLVRAFQIVSTIGCEPAGYPRAVMRAHILLHVVPASYLIVASVGAASPTVSTLDFIPVAFFFGTGRWTWQALHEQFGSTMYRLFSKGNSGMLVSLPAFLALAMLYDQRLGSDLFHRALYGYFTVHCLLTGIAVLKMEKDVFRMPGIALSMR